MENNDYKKEESNYPVTQHQFIGSRNKLRGLKKLVIAGTFAVLPLLVSGCFPPHRHHYPKPTYHAPRHHPKRIIRHPPRQYSPRKYNPYIHRR